MSLSAPTFTQSTSVTAGGTVTVACPGAATIWLKNSLVDSIGAGATYVGQPIVGATRLRITGNVETYQNALTPPVGVRVTAYGEDGQGNIGPVARWITF